MDEAQKFSCWGVDGCRDGWVFVGLNENQEACGFVQKDFAGAFARALEYGGKLILVDMPIGLSSDERERCCDRRARRCLGKRGSSVFRTPCRQAIEVYGKTGSTEAAWRENKRISERKLSRQSWAIAAKIHEVDVFLRGDAQARQRVREVHPELCFKALHGATLQYNKKRSPGRCEREGILDRHLGPGKARLYLQEIRKQYFKKIVADDDVYDALAAALTALLAQRGAALKTLPEHPPKDRRQLPMEMVYVEV